MDERLSCNHRDGDASSVWLGLCLLLQLNTCTRTLYYTARGRGGEAGGGSAEIDRDRQTTTDSPPRRGRDGEALWGMEDRLRQTGNYSPPRREREEGGRQASIRQI